MRQFKALRRVEFASGTIGLSDAQAAVRSRAVKKTKSKGVYTIAAPVEFKAGEVICLEDVPKSYLAHLEEIETKNGDKA